MKLLFPLLMVLLFVSSMDAQNYRATNISGQVVYDVHIAIDSERSDELKVFRGQNVLRTGNALDNLLPSPFVNLTSLTASDGKTAYRIPAGSASFYLIPYNRYESIVKLNPGDRLELICGFGETPPDDPQFEGVCVVSYTSIDGHNFFHCEMKVDYGSLCQPYLIIYSRDGSVRERIMTGAILVQAESVNSVSSRSQF